MNKGSNQSGFTLIEMLIVIAVIAILAGIVITGISGFQASARDTKRIADIRSAQNLLELYFNACGVYPGDEDCGSDDPGGDAASWGDLESAVTGKLGISNFPGPPGGVGSETGGALFRYDVNDTQTAYVLAAELEGDSSATREPFTPPSWMSSNIDCGPGDSSNPSVFCAASE